MKWNCRPAAIESVSWLRTPSGPVSTKKCGGGEKKVLGHECYNPMLSSSNLVQNGALVRTIRIVYDDSRIESGASAMATKRKNWKVLVKGLLKAELKRRNFSYADLAAKLATIGVKDSERNISNKISRGSFSAVFFVQCLEAIGCHAIHLTDGEPP
jgi:hypothetical protein